MEWESVPGMTTPIWVATSADADRALQDILAHPVCGFDTEFYGCDITSESPVGTAKVHVFSVAAPTGPLLPRGYHEATAWVFDGSLLGHQPVRDWLEDPFWSKAIHNQPVDAHACRNAGVCIRGGVNTLAMARFWYPERAMNGRGFDLDGLGQDMCGQGKTEDFRDLLGYEVTEEYPVESYKQACSCGVLGCRKKIGHEKGRWESVWTTRKRKVKKLLSLTDLHPGHELWARYQAYAAWDAVLALWVWELMVRDNRERSYPWA